MIDPDRYAELGEPLRTCPACGYRCPESYHYCPACGAAMVDDAPLPEPPRRRRAGVQLGVAFLLGLAVGWALFT